MDFSYQQKKSIAYLTSNMIAVIFYLVYVFGYNTHLALDTDIQKRFYGIAIIAIIPVMSVVNIIVHIIFTVIHKVQTNEMGEQFTDELDKQIELKANNNAYGTFMFGFLISMVSMIMELPVYWLIDLQVGAMFTASLVWSCSTLYFYRNGF